MKELAQLPTPTTATLIVLMEKLFLHQDLCNDCSSGPLAVQPLNSKAPPRLSS